MRKYIYKGDRLTDPKYKNAECNAVRRKDGKCIRGRNGNMLVTFNGKQVVVMARQLRKIAISVQLENDFSMYKEPMPAGTGVFIYEALPVKP